jgi:predicted ABC-type ATPase
MPKRSKARPRCLIIAGPNGAGKTTFARNYLLQDAGIENFVNADAIAAGLSPLMPQRAARAAGRLLLQELDRLSVAGESFALESTLSGLTYVDRLKSLKEHGYFIEIIFLRLETPELAVKRVAHRVKQGGHHVPDMDVRRRFARGLRNFEQAYKPLADQWAMYENSGATPILIQRHP